jgi:ABC-type amino acid transport system permease subunit
MAAQSYPSEYEWQYMTISSLLYQDRNPHGYGWGRAGLVICGVCGLYWVLRAVRGHGITTASLAAGYLCMALCALLPSPLLGIPKPHEVLALTAFIAVCVGVTRLSFATLVRRKRGAQADRQRLYALAVSSLPLLPVVLAGAAQTYAERAHLPWVSLAWRARGIAPYWSFAFWEWLACAIYTAFLLWLVLGERASDSPERF